MDKTCQVLFLLHPRLPLAKVPHKLMILYHQVMVVVWPLVALLVRASPLGIQLPRHPPLVEVLPNLNLVHRHRVVVEVRSGYAGRSQSPQQSAPTASTSGKSSTTNQPRPHHKNQGNNRPRINRPPKALSEARTNKYHALEMEAGYDSGCSDYESDYLNPFHSIQLLQND